MKKKNQQKKINSLDQLKDFLLQESFTLKEDSVNLSEDKNRKEEDKLLCQQLKK